MVPYNQINIDAPVSDAFRQVGLPWAQLLVSIGAVAGITSVLLVMMLSQPRIFLAMARDGLLPTGFFAAIHERFRTPWKSTILTGVFVAAMGAFLPLRILAELVNIGTLLAFVIVARRCLIMRRTHPEVHRPFRAPLGSVVPVLGILSCLMLMFSLPAANWLRLVVWLADRLGDLFRVWPASQPVGQSWSGQGTPLPYLESELTSTDNSLALSLLSRLSVPPRSRALMKPWLPNCNNSPSRRFWLGHEPCRSGGPGDSHPMRCFRGLRLLYPQTPQSGFLIVPGHLRAGLFRRSRRASGPRTICSGACATD